MTILQRIPNPTLVLPIETGLGNAVLLTPMIRTLKQVSPGAQVHLYGSNRFGANDLFEGDSDIAQVWREIPKVKPDIFIYPFIGGRLSTALTYKVKNPTMTIVAHSPDSFWGAASLRLVGGQCIKMNYLKHEISNYLAMLEPLGVQNTDWIDQPSLSQNVVQKGVEKSRSFGVSTPYVVVQVGAANAAKSVKKWPASSWENLFRLMQDWSGTIVLVGDKNEAELADKICQNLQVRNMVNLCGQTTILSLIGLLSEARAVVGADSGVCHLSAALGRPTVVLWGPSVFVRSHQVGPSVSFVSRHYPCAPCTGAPGLKNDNGEALEKCVYKNRCMTDIRPEEVQAALLTYLT